MASFIALRRSLPTKQPKGLNVDLVGNGTAWSGSTAWSVSGVAGCSIAHKGDVAATLARLVIATGSATGTLTISDGTLTTTVAVYDAALPTARRYAPLPHFRRLR